MDNNMINLMKEKGCRITPQRRAIIESLLDAVRPPTAREVHQMVQSRYPEISLDTVYRNLNLLADMGFVIQINLRNNETSRYEIVEKHHHHLICLGCGEAVCLDSCILNDVELTTVEDKGYQIVGHAFEIYGYCPVCRTIG